MFRFSVILALTAAPLQAQDIGATLATHLDAIPVAALALFDGPPEIEFADLTAAALAVSAPPPDAYPYYTEPIGPAFRAPISDLANVLSPDLVAQWSDRVGFGIGDVTAWSSVVRPPERLLIVGLDPAVISDVTAALTASGYTATDAQGFPAFFRNDNDYGIDIAARDPANPFGGQLGQASRIAFAGDLLMHSPGWPALTAAMADTGPSLADRADIAALVTSLDALPGDRALVTARLALDATMYAPRDIGLSAPDDSLRVPFWSAGLIADLSDGRTEMTAIALSYATRDLAKSAAQVVERQWSTVILPYREATLADLTEATLTVSVAGDGPFVALAHATMPTTTRSGRILNHVYQVLQNALYSGELILIAP